MMRPQHQHSRYENKPEAKPTSETDFATIYHREWPRLLRFFFRKLGNRADADELAQETMTRFLKAAPTITVITPQAYLTRIATNMLRDRAERSSTRLSHLSVPLEEGQHKSNGIDPHREVEARQEVEHWRLILEKLPPRTLEIFLLNRVEGYSYREIASDQGLPLWVVQKHMLKAIRHIAAHRGGEHD